MLPGSSNANKTENHTQEYTGCLPQVVHSHKLVMRAWLDEQPDKQEPVEEKNQANAFPE